MFFLGIETSSDDTCISLIRIKTLNSKPKTPEIVSNIISSQVKLHARYGGIYPFLAKREHRKNLPIVFKKATKGISLSEINLIGVTIGPGLEPCLWEGINFAKKLAKKLKLPIVPINHIEAHILANFLDENFPFLVTDQKKLLPAICLVVSGGHTQLILMKSIGEYQLIGETRDDAAGECLDKVARILGLGYPGGPAIAKMANKLKKENLKLKIKLPRPMINQKNYDFSFAGLKTAVLYDFKSRPEKIRKSKDYILTISFEVQQAIIDVLISKTIKAVEEFKVKSIILGGGVSANDKLREQFLHHPLIFRKKLNFFAPAKILSTDNGAMVAFSSYIHQKEATRNWQTIRAEANLKI